MRGRIPAWPVFMSDLSEQIESAVANPTAVAVDGQSVTNRAIADLIAADKHLASRTAASRGFRGLMRQQVRSPDARGSNSEDT